MEHPPFIEDSLIKASIHGGFSHEFPIKIFITWRRTRPSSASRFATWWMPPPSVTCGKPRSIRALAGSEISTSRRGGREPTIFEVVVGYIINTSHMNMDMFIIGLIWRQYRNNWVSCKFPLQSIVTRAPLAFFLVLRGSYPTVWCRLMLMETIEKRTAWDIDLPWIMEFCAMVNTRSVGTRVCAHIGFVTWGPSCSQSSTWRCFTVPQRGRVNISGLAKLKATNPNIKSVSQDGLYQVPLCPLGDWCRFSIPQNKK